MRTRQNFEILQGQDWDLRLVILDGDGSPVTLATTMAGATWNLGPSLDAGAAVLSKTAPEGLTLGDDGTAVVHVANADDVPVGVYFHELLVQEADSGKMYAVARGLVTVRPSVVTS